MSTPQDDGDDLRALLRDAVSDVHPEGLAKITSRTGDSRPSPTRWLPLTLAAAAAVVAVIGGVAWVANVASQNPPAAGPDELSGVPTRDPDGRPERDVNVPVVYVGATAAGPRLFLETHKIVDTDESAVQVAVNEAFGARPDDPDYRNDLRGLGVTAEVGRSTGGQLSTLDLSGELERPDGMDDETAEMVVQSLVWTVGLATSNEWPVQFTVEGEPADEVLGVDTSKPVARGSADSVLAAVSIESPTQGSVVAAPFDVVGDAAAFEANVVWELKQGDTVVKQGFTTAAECCTLSPYRFAVDAPPGDYTLVVHDTDPSDGEGIGPSQDTKEITVLKVGQ